MRKLIITGLAAAMLAAAVPAQADAAPYLSSGEACRWAGRTLYQEYNNVLHGSSICSSKVIRRDVRRVKMVYADQAYNTWVTTMNVRECAWWERYAWKYRILSDHRYYGYDY